MMLSDRPNMLADTGNTGLTPAQKLSIIADRYRMPALNAMQPSETIIYDTIDMATLSTTGSSTVNFFANVNTKNFPFANLQQNKLNAGNVLVVQYVNLAVLQVASGVITDVRTLEEDESATVGPIYKPLTLSQLTFVIGSSEVFKDLPLQNLYAGMNPNAKFGAKSRSGAANNPVVQYGNSVATLASEPVILPNLEFKAMVQIPAISALPTAGTRFLRLSLGGFGTIPSMAKPV